MILSLSLSLARAHTHTHTQTHTHTHTHTHAEEQTQHREMVPVAQMEVSTEKTTNKDQWCTKTMQTFKLNDASLSHQRNLHAT
jgi:hypothetical protein